MVSLAMAVASLQSQYQHNASHSVSWQGRQGRLGVKYPAEHQTLRDQHRHHGQVRSGQVGITISLYFTSGSPNSKLYETFCIQIRENNKFYNV